jgi:tetratricopeptide (TPR) repeat protein
MVYYYLDYPELARKSYQTALILNPDDFNTHYNLGELFYGVIGDTVAALKEFKNAFILNPSLYEAAFKIGLICMKNGMNKEAVHYFELALKRVPDDVRILLQCAVAWERLERRDRAAEKYRTVLAVDELNSIARLKLKLLSQY